MKTASPLIGTPNKARLRKCYFGGVAGCSESCCYRAWLYQYVNSLAGNPAMLADADDQRMNGGRYAL